MLDMTSSDLRRFWSRVRLSDGCWQWTGFCDKKGYGTISIGNKTQRAARVAYHNFIAPVPPELLTCHHCDNPRCVRPDHLFLGTRVDNAQDALLKGRYNAPKGEDHHGSKLISAQVMEIRELLSRSIPVKHIAQEYGVNPSTIHAIKSGKAWKHATSASSYKWGWKRRDGESHPKAKLKSNEVWLIRHLCHHGTTSKQVARMFRVSVSSVAFIRRGVTWKDIAYP